MALVLTGSVAHATWNLLVKRVPDGGRLFVWVYSAVALVLCTPVAIVMALRSEPVVRPAWLLASLGSALLHLAYALCLQWAYARSDLAVSYPVSRGAGPVLATAVAVALLGERPGPLALVGAVAVIAGAAVLAWPDADPDADPDVDPDVDPDPRPAARSGASAAVTEAVRRRPVVSSLAGLLVGVTIAGYTVWDDHSMTVLHVPPVPYYLGASALQFIVLTLATLGSWREVPSVVRRHGGTAVAVAVLAPASYLLVLEAMRLAPLSVVAPLRSTSVVVGALAAAIVLRERRHLVRRSVGTAIVVAGVCGLAG